MVLVDLKLPLPIACLCEQSEFPRDAGSHTCHTPFNCGTV